VGRNFENVVPITNPNPYAFGDKDVPDFPSSIKELYHTVPAIDTKSVASYSSHRSERSEPSDVKSKHKQATAYAVPVPPPPITIVDDEPFYDYRYIWGTGVMLMLVSAVYFYWLAVYDCNHTENEVTNMTMQYAIDQVMRRNEQPGTPTGVQVEGAQA
jgi:hypothetical protein